VTDTMLDEMAWSYLVGAVGAAHALDQQELKRRTLAAAREVPLPGLQEAGLYVWYLLRCALADAAGQWPPADDELRRISEDHIQRFTVLLPAGRENLEDLFRHVFERAARVREVTAGDLLLQGSAALGVLYDDPDRELEAMKPRLEYWWRLHSAKFHGK
jgi:hypothetical protein